MSRCFCCRDVGVACSHGCMAHSLACGCRCTRADVMMRLVDNPKSGSSRQGRVLPFARRTVMWGLFRCSEVHPTTVPRAVEDFWVGVYTSQNEGWYLGRYVPRDLVRPLVDSGGGGPWSCDVPLVSGPSVGNRVPLFLKVWRSSARCDVPACVDWSVAGVFGYGCGCRAYSG